MMFVKVVVLDDNETWRKEGYLDEQITPDLVEGLIRRLDGKQHTLLTLGAEDEIHHMAIGGNARVGLVVYHTYDNHEFHNLLSDDPDNHDTIELVCGGQRCDFESRCVVAVEAAVLAAREFVVTGLLAEQLAWEFK